MKYFPMWKWFCCFHRLGSAKPPSAVIVDSKKLSEDEDDEDGQFVVEEAGSLSTNMPEIEMVSVLRCVLI